MTHSTPIVRTQAKYGRCLTRACARPRPRRRNRPPDLLGFLTAARSNPLTTWTKAHFEKPILYGKGVMGRVLVLNEPQAIRHVLLE